MRVAGNRSFVSVLLVSATVTLAFAQPTALDIALEAFRATADQRDGSGAMRAAEIHVRFALEQVNAVAGEVAIREVTSSRLIERIDVALQELLLARNALQDGVWTVSAEGFPWEAVRPLLPPPAREFQDPNDLNKWMYERIVQIEMAISSWSQGGMERGVIFSAQLEMGRLHLVLTRAVSAQTVPPLPELQ